MISVRCPHCQVGLKVDKSKLPSDINSFKCPKCAQLIPVSILEREDGHGFSSPETVVLHPNKKGVGQITVLPDSGTQQQVFLLSEGTTVIGRKSSHTPSHVVGIITGDKSMSREHICIEVKKDARGSYKHYLSDNKSKNYTLYNSNYLGEGEVVILNDNDEIVIGRTMLRFNE